MGSDFMERKFVKDEETEGMKPKVPSEPEVLTILRKSRKAYLIEYSCGLLLLGLTGYARLQEINLPSWLWYFFLGLGLSIASIGEIARLFNYYEITNSKLIIVKGIIKQKKKNVNYHPLAFVPDISMAQGRVQRFLNFGTVYVDSGSASFEIKDVDRPKEVMELIESLIEKTRRGG